MRGDVVKYRFYKQSSNSLITIPRALARVLKWRQNDKIHIEYRTIENWKGLFIFKGKSGELVKYQAKQSTITIPISVARALGWKDKDDIHVMIKDIKDQTGLFLYK
jgi:hypothetical protein